MKFHAQLSSPILAVLLLLQTAEAITIQTNFRDSGQTLGTFGTAGGAPSSAVGGGNLQLLVEAAADYWESAFADPFVLTIDYGWFPRASSAATHRLASEGGSPHRETAATIAFDNDSVLWFLDLSPLDNVEFSTFTAYLNDLGGGLMNTGREYTGGSGSAARFDLLTTAIHEVGHALGLSNANNAFQETARDSLINISGNLPFSGAAIPIVSGEAHLNLAHALLRPSRPSGVRRFASEADILSNAQISQFSQVNLTPVIPEPAVSCLLSLTLLLGGLRASWSACRANKRIPRLAS
ncbi:MAG TPA: hypothetical protein VF585_12060 [Chthoniobacterales bacterium]|jgi:hypothetical protein